MKPITGIMIGTVALLGVGASGYWLGARTSQVPTEVASAVATKKEPKILYYRNPMGLPDTSPTPKKDNMGMDCLPVYEGGGDPDSGNQTTSTGSEHVKISVEKVQKLAI